MRTAPTVEGMPMVGEPPQSSAGAFGALLRHPDGSNYWPEFEAAAAAMYQDCPPAAALAAFQKLRPQQTALWAHLTPLPRWPAAPLFSIVCTEDRLFNPTWSNWVARNWLNVAPIEIPGGHSPMLSRPGVLAHALAGTVTPSGS